MNELDRLKLAIQLMKAIGLGKTQKDIGLLLGYSNPSSFSQVLTAKVAIPDKLYRRIEEVAPQINTEYIKTGAGELMNAQPITQNVAVNGSTAVAGNNNNVKGDDNTTRFLDQLSAAHSLLAKKDEQIDRLITLLERNTNGSE